MPNHLKSRRSKGYSIPHFKSITLVSKDENDKNIDHKGIFYFGSHNLTPSAWNHSQKSKNNNDYLL